MLVHCANHIITEITLQKQEKDESADSYEVFHFSMTFLLKSISSILTTARANESGFTAFVLKKDVLEEWSVISNFCSLLGKVLQSGFLPHIANALDCFFEVWSEEFYNDLLIQHGIVEYFKTGEPVLRSMFRAAKKEASFTPSELEEIEEALDNMIPFAQYKSS